MRPFYLQPRGKIFYVQLVDPKTKRILTAKSTRKTTRDEALMVVYDWLAHGVPSKKSNKKQPVEKLFSVERILATLRTEPLEEADCLRILEVLRERNLVVSATLPQAPDAEFVNDFLLRFWNHDSSPYRIENEAFERKLKPEHFRESTRRIRKYWIPYFEGLRLCDLTFATVKQFALSLADPGHGIAASTRNRIFTAGKTALRWAFANGLIKTDSTKDISKYVEVNQDRGVLEFEEAVALFEQPWPDETFLLINQVAATTGMRAGEIAALREEDILEEFVFVKHSYSEDDGLDTTKNGEPRHVPILPELRDRMRAVASFNPHGNGFVFWGNLTDAPRTHQKFSNHLRDMLVRLRTGSTGTKEAQEEAEDYWKKRNVVFHSWRHFYTTHISKTSPAERVMLATGHKTRAVYETYRNHVVQSELQKLKRASTKTFKGIVPKRASSEAGGGEA